MAPHGQVIIGASLRRHSLLWWVGTSTTSPTQIRITLSLGSEASARLFVAWAFAGTSSEEVARTFAPHTVFGAEEGILNARARFFVARPFVIAWNEGRMDLGLLDVFKPCHIIILHRGVLRGAVPSPPLFRCGHAI